MLKRIYWTVLGLVCLAGIGAMVYLGIQPRPIEKISLSKFDNPKIMANAVLLRLRQELQLSPVIVIGVQPQHIEQLEVLREFLNNNREDESLAFQKIYRDSSVNSDLFPEAEVVHFQDEFANRLEEIKSFLDKSQRVLIIAPTTFTAQVIPSSLTFFLNKNLTVKQKALSLSMIDFPRNREEEKNFEFPCVVEGVDQSGLGPFGCLLLQSSRSKYRKRFQQGEKIGFVNQIGQSDYLIFYTAER